MGTFHIAADLLRDAARRKWFLALALLCTLCVAVAGLGLKMDVVDGAVSATRLFGKLLDPTIQAADVALRPLFMAVAALIFYLGTLFMILACADFAPSLFAPGRIEHLLSLPVRRWELLAGTYLGVLTLATMLAVYGAGGMTLVLGVKTGVWTLKPLVAALLAVVSFATIYAAMLGMATFVRSTALSAAVGGLVFVLGIVAGARDTLVELFEAGWGRRAFQEATLVFPRISALGQAAIRIAGARQIELSGLGHLLLAFGVFSAAVLTVGVWQLERKDF